jgi:hemerythrin-like domain-containing protein
MTTPTSDLRSEHVGVTRMLNIMGKMADRIAERMAADEKPDTAEVDEVIEFLRVFVDQCHHGKEEQLLFPAVREAGIGSAEDVLPELMEEHTQGREIVARIVRANEDAKSGETGNDTTDLIDAFTRFRELLREHILREERDCFKIADEQLSPEVAQQLQEGYDRIERDVVGEGRHEAFHAMLDRLESEYGLRH